MKSIIRIAILLVVVIIGNTEKASAQSGPEVCKIHYDYDISGNRIKRAYKCERTWTIGDPLPWVSGSILSSLSPNPTTGTVTGVFTETVPSATVWVNTMGGVTVFQQNYTQLLSSFTIDLSAQVPGTYLVTVAALNQVETYTIIKM